MQGNKKKKEGWAVFILFFPLHFGPMISPDLRATIHNRKNRERAKHQHATILVFVLTMCQSFRLLRFVWQLSSYVSDRIINRSRPLTAASDPLTFFKYHNRCTSFFSRHLPNDSSFLFSANGSCNNVPLLSSSLWLFFFVPKWQCKNQRKLKELISEKKTTCSWRKSFYVTLNDVKRQWEKRACLCCCWNILIWWRILFPLASCSLLKRQKRRRRKKS